MTAPNEAAPVVLYPEIVCELAEGVNAITCQRAKDLIGWETEIEYRERLKTTELFEDDYFTTDGYDRKIRCRKNNSNRPYERARASKHKQDILNKRWSGPNGNGESINGEPLIIGRYGNILSGQHRIAGFIEACETWEKPSCKSVWKQLWATMPVLDTLIVYGISEVPKVTRTIDNTATRTLADVLFADAQAYKGHPVSVRKQLCRETEQAVRLLWERSGVSYYHSHLPSRTHSEACDFFEGHPKLQECIQVVHKLNEGGHLNPIIGPGYAAALLYLQAVSATSAKRYRETALPNEQLLEFSRWEQAKGFWKVLADKGPRLAALRHVRRPIEGDLPTNWTGYVFVPTESESAGGHERVAVLAKAWQYFLAAKEPKAKSLQLEYAIKYFDDGSIRTWELNEDPKIGGIDIGREGYPQEEEELPSQEHMDIEERKSIERKAKVAKLLSDRKTEKPKAQPIEDSRLKQLERLKERYPNHVLLFISKDHVTAWGEDAQEVSRVINARCKISIDGMSRVQLVRKDLEGVLRKCLAANIKVAICEQESDKTMKIEEHEPKSAAQQPERG